MLFVMGKTSEEDVQVSEPLTYALFKWLEAIDAWTYATYKGDDSGDE